MKLLLIGFLTLASLSSFASDYYDCREQKLFQGDVHYSTSNVLTHQKGAEVVDIYDFGGAGDNCRHIALKLNIQKLNQGDAKFYDCEMVTRVELIIKSDLGNVVTLVPGNFTCEKLALSLNRNL